MKGFGDVGHMSKIDKVGKFGVQAYVVHLIQLCTALALASDLFRHSQGDIRHGQDDVRHGQDDVRQGQGDVRHGQDDVRQGHGDVRHGQGEVRHSQGAAYIGQITDFFGFL
jgi:hypothetical protein